MSIAAAILLGVVGAILYFAVDDEISGIDLQTVGLILMIAGVAGFLLTMVIQASGRNRRTERIVEREDIRERY